MLLVPALFFALFTIGSFSMNKPETPEITAEEIQEHIKLTKTK